MDSTVVKLPISGSAKSRRRSAFQQADLKRAIRAATQASLQVVMARIKPDGCIKLAFGTAKSVASTGSNPWDR
jgi:hypothetical protein